MAEEKKKLAVAISYDTTEEAPQIVASGKGIIADKIIDKAMEAKVPVHQDHKLAASLSKLELGSCIPPELYQVVSEVLLFVDDLDRLKDRLKR